MSKRPLTRPAPAAGSAGAGHPLPGGEGYGFRSTPGVQPKMWDTLSPKREGYISGLGTGGVQPKMWDTLSPWGEGGDVAVAGEPGQGPFRV